MDRWDNQPTRKSGLQDWGLVLWGAGWVVSTFKMYFVPVARGECPLAAPSCRWRTWNRDLDALVVSREPGASTHPELTGSSPPTHPRQAASRGQGRAWQHCWLEVFINLEPRL